MVWTDATIHVLDFEGSRRSGILEFGIATLRGGRVAEARTRLCGPVGRMEEAEIAVHRIERKTVLGAAPFAEEWDLFRGLRAGGVFAAHFSGVENHLLKSVWAYPPPSPDFGSPGRMVNDWGPWIDSGRIYENVFPDLESANLEALIGTFGYQAELDRLAAEFCPPERCGYHAALYDALAAAVLLVKLLERPEMAGATVPWLLRMSRGRVAGNAVAQGELFE